MKYIFSLFSVLIGINATAQDCNSFNHSINSQDSWQSCELAVNPNPIRENSHWVLYDFGYVYSLGQSYFWNYNVENETDKGMRNIVLDYSLDGTSWTAFGSFQLGEASGENSYQGEEALNLNGTNARYVLITAIDTWGSNCAGLSEVRFDIDGTVAVNKIDEKNQRISLYPNPTSKHISIETDLELKELIIVNQTGQELQRMPKYSNQIDVSFLPNGIYYLKCINSLNEMMIKKFVIQQ